MEVLVEASGDSYSFKTGIITEIVSETIFAVMYDDDAEEDCVAARLLPMGREGTERELCRALCMNAGRCAAKLDKKTWAVRWLSAAVALVEGSAEYASRSQHLLDGFTARCKVLLSLGKVQLARRDALAVHAFSPEKSGALLREVDQKQLAKQKLDRKLAKDVAAWVGTAMETNARLGGDGV